ncbi:MAG: VanW family protein [Deltaproteobacteria bacterium]|nr:VanW family protein [Deltaproteobacteria bacterium]
MADRARSHDVAVGYPRAPGKSTSTGAAHAKRRWRVASLGAAVLGVASIILLVAYFWNTRHAGEIPVLAQRQEAPSTGESVRTPLAAAVSHYIEQPIVLTFDGHSFETTWRALGVTVDEVALGQKAARLESSGVMPEQVPATYFDGERASEGTPVALDREKGLEALVAYKDAYDRPALDARIDLEKRKVVPEAAGYGIHVYESLAVVEENARAGKRAVALAGGVVEPTVTREKLGNLDISHVMGWFETKYPPGEKDRNYNLKLVAEKLNGHILMPGQDFSFNAVVGDRTEKEGYRVAHVIQAGEMVDGLAGGACQISSTLHGASWFSGLEVLDSRPHSRPSAYITMGLDATVVYPTVDLKLRNPYDFPVVIRYVVSQGTVRVEILGKERPYGKIAYEREVKKEIPFETITREDDTMPVGSSLVEQIGFPGYELIRRRLYYRDRKVVKVDKWNVRYPPTTEYLRVGSNPDPNLTPPKQPSLHGPVAPGKDPIYRMFQ